MSGKIIVKGPKCGRLFPLQLPTQDGNKSKSALLCDSCSNKCQLWHKRLGHPNSKTLMFLLNSTLLNVNNRASFDDVSFDCTSCKIGKSETLPFSMHDSLALHCFDPVHGDAWGIALMLSHSHFKYFVRFT